MLSKQAIITLCLFVYALSVSCQSSNPIKWKFATQGKVYSHLLINENIVYFGSMDSVFYAINAESGQKVWSYKTASPIQSKAIIYNSVVYFKAGNDAYALNKLDGSEIWASINKDSSLTGQIDPWDFHSGSPAVYKTLIYFGFQNGKLVGFDMQTGEQKHILKEDTVAIKSEILIEGSILYYGDWNGKVHAFNLEEGKELWVHETYEKRLYPTFGPVNSEIELANGNLYYGARNPEIRVLKQKTGEVAWSFEEREGGWISGDPVVYNDTMYIGGSDNHEMLAFNANTGEKLWSYLFLNNNFSKPLIYGKNILFTTGDAYNIWGDKPGRGYLYALNRKDGSIKNFAYIGGNLYSSIVLDNGFVYCGSSDNNLYAIDLKEFLNEESNLNNKGYKAFDFINIAPNAFDSITQVEYKVNYITDLKVRITDIKEDEVVILSNKKETEGEYAITWNGKDKNGNEVVDAYYFVEITAHDFVKKSFVQKKSDDERDK